VHYSSYILLQQTYEVNLTCTYSDQTFQFTQDPFWFQQAMVFVLGEVYMNNIKYCYIWYQPALSVVYST